MSSANNTTQQDEAEIRGMLAAWNAAFEARDVDSLTANYLPVSVLYDAIPPYKVVGQDAIRQFWTNVLPHFPEKFQSEHRDLTLHVSGDVALVHGLHHFVTAPADHPCGQTWVRRTIGFRRIDGKWKVVHEHVSLPHNPANNLTWKITNPDVVDMPGEGQSFVEKLD